MKHQSSPLQRGVSLIEVLVALFVLAFGMLGIAGMQTMAMKANQSAFERNAAVIAAYSMADRMRSNQTLARNGTYNRDLPASGCEIPTGTEPATIDINQWLTGLASNLGAGSCGGITCSGTPVSCRITVRWDDSRVTNGASDHTFQVDVRI